MHQRRQRPLREDLPPEWFETDECLRAVIGSLVLANHPDGIGLADLRYELSADEDDDSVERAVEAMVAEKLLRREGETVLIAFPPIRVRVLSLEPTRNGSRPPEEY